MKREDLARLDVEALDDLVHDSKAAEAAAINNQGKEAQIAYLLGLGQTQEPIDGDDLELEPEPVDIIASGYEWVCPNCEDINRAIDWRETVVCRNCRRKYEASSPEHAWG
jgi:hypothetical protein